jgi:hypothetical protein
MTLVRYCRADGLVTKPRFGFTHSTRSTAQSRRSTRRKIVRCLTTVMLDLIKTQFGYASGTNRTSNPTCGHLNTYSVL